MRKADGLNTIRNKMKHCLLILLKSDVEDIRKLPYVISFPLFASLFVWRSRFACRVDTKCSSNSVLTFPESFLIIFLNFTTSKIYINNFINFRIQLLNTFQTERLENQYTNFDGASFFLALALSTNFLNLTSF